MHVEGIFCLGRRGGEIRDGGSDLGFLLIRVKEFNVSGCVGFVELWVGVVVCVCKLGFIIMSLLLYSLRAIVSQVSGGWCVVGLLCFGLLMLISPMG